MNLPPANWSKLRQAHGDCSHIPQAILDIRSTERGVREQARWQIENHVVLQGDLYEGAPWVANALLHELPTAPDYSKVLIYDLLMELLIGSAPDSRVVRIEGRSIPLQHATEATVALGRKYFKIDSRHVNNRKIRQLAMGLLEELNDRGL